MMSPARQLRRAITSSACCVSSYQVLNQYGTPLQEAGLTPEENLTGSTLFYGAASGPYDYVPLGAPTNASGQFVDSPLGECSPVNVAATDTIMQRITVQVFNLSNTCFFGTPISIDDWTVTFNNNGPYTITNGTNVSFTCQLNGTCASY
jgi:hypothetical protein